MPFILRHGWFKELMMKRMIQYVPDIAAPTSKFGLYNIIYLIIAVSGKITTEKWPFCTKIIL